MEPLPITDQTIREAIKTAMGEQKLTQKELADKLGIKQPSVADVIGGRRGRVPQSLIDILEALGLELTARKKS